MSHHVITVHSGGLQRNSTTSHHPLSVSSRLPAGLLPSPEALLPGGVPDLQLDPLPGLDLHQAGEEVHAHGGVGHLGEATLREPPDQTRLAHRGVPDDDEAELVEPYGLHDDCVAPPRAAAAAEVWSARGARASARA